MILVTICINDLKIPNIPNVQDQNRMRIDQSCVKLNSKSWRKRGWNNGNTIVKKICLNETSRKEVRARQKSIQSRIFPFEKSSKKRGPHEKPRLGVGRPKTDRPNLCESLVYCQRLNTVISIHSPSSSLFLLPSLSFTLTLVRLVRCTIYRFLRPRFLYTRVD